MVPTVILNSTQYSQNVAGRAQEAAMEGMCGKIKMDINILWDMQLYIYLNSVLKGEF